MHVSIGRRVEDVFVTCEVCGHECAVPGQVTAAALVHAFLALHPASAHSPSDCPDWSTVE